MITSPETGEIRKMASAGLTPAESETKRSPLKGSDARPLGQCRPDATTRIIVPKVGPGVSPICTTSPSAAPGPLTKSIRLRYRFPSLPKVRPCGQRGESVEVFTNTFASDATCPSPWLNLKTLQLSMSATYRLPNGSLAKPRGPTLGI